MSGISQIRHVVLDMDGTIYLGERLFPATLPFLALLTERGIGFTFVTNNCARSRAEYVERLRQMGIAITPEAVSTSAQATIHHLQSNVPAVKRLFVLGTTGLQDDLRDAGYDIVDDRPDAVIVGYDTGFTYDRLARTAWWISQRLPYIATHPDRVCPTNQPTVLPDCGAICALLAAATGREPDAVPGKPNPAMVQAILRRTGLAANEVAMVGDRLYTDMRMARDAGLLAILTLTGEASREDIQRAPANEKPDIIVNDLNELAKLLENT